jgi:hypothetical protein
LVLDTDSHISKIKKTYLGLKSALVCEVCVQFSRRLRRLTQKVQKQLFWTKLNREIFKSDCPTLKKDKLQTNSAEKNTPKQQL